MAPKAFSSTHSSRRTYERLDITEWELFDILDKGHTVDMGTEGSSNREHRLFFSRKDGDFFVAIQDNRNGEIITVLPLDYHANMAWVVPEPYLVLAMEKAL